MLFDNEMGNSVSLGTVKICQKKIYEIFIFIISYLIGTATAVQNFEGRWVQYHAQKTEIDPTTQNAFIMSPVKIKTK